MPPTSQQDRSMTPDENFRELYKRVAQLNDKMSALLNPGWGAQAGILPADHPLAPTTENAQQEQGAPVDWRAIAEQREQELKALGERKHIVEKERDEARQWARHGYEIGQKHCSWSDHGVAPTWLTEGWPPHIDSCEHLKKAAEYDEALTRVRTESHRIRATTRTWEPVADLIDAAIEGPIREQRERPAHPDGTPYRYSEIVAEGWGHCDGCKLWSTGTPRRPHQCAETHMQGPSQEPSQGGA